VEISVSVEVVVFEVFEVVAVVVDHEDTPDYA
jgi:hypothetical protein